MMGLRAILFLLVALVAVQSAEVEVSQDGKVDTPEDNIYETDSLVTQYCEFHYGSDYYSVPNFPFACIENVMEQVREKGIETGRALDLGCAVGRASFELAKHFQHVDAIDFSARFIEQGVQVSIRFYISKRVTYLKEKRRFL